MANDEISNSVSASNIPIPGDMRTKKVDPFGGLGDLASEDLSNIKIGQDPSILDDPNANPNEKLQIMNSLDQAAGEYGELQNQKKEAQAVSDASAFDQYNKKILEVSSANQKLSALGKPQLPTPVPGHFGLTPEKMAALSQPEVQQQLVPAMSQAMAEQEQAQQQKDFDSGVLLQQRQMLQKDIADNRRIDEAQKRMDDAYAKYDSDQDQISEIDPSRFWKNKSTGEKIFGILGILLGGGKDGQNYAYDAINKAVETDIGAQKVSNEQKIALRQNAMKRVGMEVERFSSVVKSEKDKRELKMLQQKLQSDMGAARDSEVQRIALQKHLTSGEGLSQEEAAVLIPDNSPTRGLLVTMPNGRVKKATSKDSADKLNTWNPEIQKARALTNTLVSQIKDLQGGSTSDRLLPTMFSEKKAALRSTTSALTGSLRLPFTGPGILNETEYQRLQSDVIGNPDSLMQPGLALKKAEQLQTLLAIMQDSQYKAAGIQLSPERSKRVALTKALAEKGYNFSEIQNALNKNGYNANEDQ